MAALDIRTTFLLCGGLYFFLALGVAVASQGPRDPARTAWFGGGMLIGLGIMLLGLRGVLPNLIARDVGMFLIPLGILQLLRSVHLNLGFRSRPLVAALVGVAVICAYFTAREFGADRFAVLLCLGLDLLLMLMLIGCLFVLASRQSLPSCRWMALAYCAAVLGMTVRTVSVAFGLSPVEPLVPADALAFAHYDVLVMLIPAVFSAVVGSFGYLGMELQLAARNASQLAAERARQEYNAQLMAQIAHLERQRSLGEMATTLAHEVKQPLTAVLSNVQLAQRMAQRLAPGQGDLAEALARAVGNTRHATEIINRISGYARATSPAKQLVDLEAVARGVLDLISSEALRHDVRIHLQGLSPAAMVRADPVQVSQILLNLLRNAMQALTDSVRRDIDVMLVRRDGTVVITVRDSGPGLSPEAVDKAGTPFFTTRADGMGVGLSISSAIASQHHGEVRITNAKGGGAIAMLTLPEAVSEREATDAAAGRAQPAGAVA